MNPGMAVRVVNRWMTAVLVILWMSSVGAPNAAAQPCEDGQWRRWNEQPSGQLLMAYDSARGVVVAVAWHYDPGLPLTPGTTWETTGSAPWVKTTTTGPGPRGGAAMVYDAARGECVLFGGVANGLNRSDTWTWDGEAWTLASNSGPAPRHNPMMTYDPDNGRVLLFGGEGDSNDRMGDTWAWNGEQWTLLRAAGPPRYLASLTYDTARHRAVLFGGIGQLNRLGDTWEFDGTAWTQVAATGPSARYGHAMAYDNQRGLTVLFGGFDGGDRGDTWEWDGVAWTLVSTTQGPGPRQDVAMTYHSGLERVVLAGGLGSDAILWDWDDEWAPRWEPPVSPPIAEGALTYDSSRQRVVANLGSRTGSMQTWEWDGQSWEMRASGGGVPYGVMTFDTVRGVAMLLNEQRETWSWNGAIWAQIASNGPNMGSIAFDSDRGVAVLYIGRTPRQTWEWDGATWALREEHDPNMKGSPGPENGFGAALCYDSNARRTVLVGGSAEFFCCLGTVWEWDGTTWTLTGAVNPGRQRAALAFDSTRNRRVLFGGEELIGSPEWFDDTWEGGLDVPWTRVDTGGPPPIPPGPAMAYDAARNNIVLYTGDFGGVTWIRTVEQITGGPSIVMQPQSAEVRLGEAVSFRVEAAGEGTLTYQWRKDGAPIGTSARILGQQSELLSIVDIVTPDQGSYDVVVSNACSSVTSEAVMLTVSDRCPADFNTDGVLNSQDFFDYLIAFFELRPEADFDESGTVDSADFFAFLDAFFEACG